jgi:hypothetical protein
MRNADVRAMATAVCDQNAYRTFGLQVLTKMKRYVLDGVAVAGRRVHALPALLDPYATGHAGPVGVDKIEEFDAKLLRLPSSVAGAATSHLQDLTSLDLGEDVVKGAAVGISAREMPPLERQEISCQRRYRGGLDDQAKK